MNSGSLHGVHCVRTVSCDHLVTVNTCSAGCGICRAPSMCHIASTNILLRSPCVNSEACLTRNERTVTCVVTVTAEPAITVSCRKVTKLEFDACLRRTKGGRTIVTIRIEGQRAQKSTRGSQSQLCYVSGFVEPWLVGGHTFYLNSKSSYSIGPVPALCRSSLQGTPPLERNLRLLLLLPRISKIGIV